MDVKENEVAKYKGLGKDVAECLESTAAGREYAIAGAKMQETETVSEPEKYQTETMSTQAEI